MSEAKEQKLLMDSKEGDVEHTESTESEEISEDSSLTKAVETYRKLIEVNELSEKQQDDLEKQIKEIQDRKIIETDVPHSPTLVNKIEICNLINFIDDSSIY